MTKRLDKRKQSSEAEIVNQKRDADQQVAKLESEWRISPPSGRPEDIWLEYERDVGPIAEAEIHDISEIFDIHRVRAHKNGDAELRVPKAVADKIFDILYSIKIGQAVKPRHRLGKSWLERQFDETAVRQFRTRKAELKAKGYKASDASEQAALEVGKIHGYSASTLLSIASHRRRRLGK